MPSTIDAVNRFLDAKILYGPGKAAKRRRCRDLGPRDVAEQHAPLLEREEVDQRLHGIMRASTRPASRAASGSARRATTSTAPTSPASEGRQRDDGFRGWFSTTRAELASI